MECFIVKEGVEQKAELEDILLLIPDRGIQNIFRDFSKAYINLPYALAHVSVEVKNLIFRNISVRIGGKLERDIKGVESKADNDIWCMRSTQSVRTKLISFIGDYANKCSYNFPEFIVWKDVEQRKEIPARDQHYYVKELIKKIEVACDSGQLKIYQDTDHMTEDDILKAFATFESRRNELQRIRTLEIEGKDLSAAALLFELGALEELEIHGEFTGTWPSFLEKCLALKSINLSLGEELSEFPSWIRNAISLQRLSIRESNLTTIPDWIGNLQSIKELSIDYYNYSLKSLPNSVGNLKNLTKLAIRRSGIEKLPDSIGNLLSLTELELNGNENLTSLPDSMGNLENLAIFNLCYSPIEILPEWIGNLKNLTQLSLVENHKMKGLPNSISKLKKLSKLELSGLSIERLPDWIGDLDNLTELSLTNNNLKFIPDSIGKLKNLVKLDLSGSPVENLPKTIMNCTLLDYIDIRGTNISLVPDCISSVRTLRQSISIFPKEHSVSYRSFCNCYYRLVETVLQFAKKGRREGLLALEEDLENLSNDFFYLGMRLVVDGTDREIIQQMLTIRIEREHDYYTKKLMEIALEGILCIYSGTNIEETIIRLSSLTNIKDNPLGVASEKYLAGDYKAFDNLDLKSAIQPEEEREEIRFIRRVMTISHILRNEGKIGLEKHLDYEGIKARDVLEYGLPLIIDNWDYEQIDKILSALIAHETNPVKKNLALAKKDAIWRLYSGDNPRIIMCWLLGYFDDSVERVLSAEN